MSYLKFNSNQFLEKQELDRWWKFINDDGYKKHLLDNTYSYGIIKEKEDANFDNFKVKEGTNNGTIQIDRKSYALDSDGNLIVKSVEDNISVTDDNQWYWVKISHQFSPIEKGTVDIDSNGNLTGSGTEFTKILRGGVNVPSVIAFTNSSNNIQDYTVLEVIDDNNVILSGASGTFTAESDLNYKIVGSFTPDYIPSSSQKDIFQYDSIKFEQILESPQGTQTSPNEPSKTQDKEFFIARVKRNGNSLIIQDKRSEFWRYKADYELNKDLVSDNPLVGVEAVKWDSKYSTRDKNIVELGWGFRTTNFSWSASLNKISISGGNGGIFKTVSDFSDGDFDGYRLYFIDGTYSIINSSSVNGSQIDLILDNFDPNKVSSGDELTIVPNVEEIEFYVQESSNENNNEIVDQVFEFNIEEGFGKLHLLVLNDANDKYEYNIKYRYKNFGQYSEWVNINDDSTGYYDEQSFNEDGTIKSTGTNRKTVSNGNIELVANVDNYFSRINEVDTGIKFGVNERNLNNGSPLIDLEVGVNDIYQIIDGQDINFNTNHYINLLTTGAQEYNRFILDLRGIDITKSTNEYYITQNFDGNGVPTKNEAEVEVTNVDDGGAPFTIEIQVKRYDTWVTIGSYEVQSNDSTTDVANELVANDSTGINDQSLYGYSAVASGSSFTITEEPSSDLLYTKYNTQVQIVYSGSQGNTNLNVVNNFQGGEILFSLSQFWIYQMSKTDCCFITYFDGNNWFLERYQKYDNQEYGGQPNVTSDGEIVIPNKGTLFDLGSNNVSPLVSIISDYHKEGDVITFYSGGLYEDFGLHVSSNDNANLRILTNNDSIDLSAGYIVFQKIGNLWYLKGCFTELEDRITTNENNINNKADKSQEAWNDVSSLGYNGSTSWGDGSGGGPAQYMKDNFGFIHLRGRIETSADADDNTIAFTLPSGYRPDNFLSLKVSEVGVISYCPEIQIDTNGEVRVRFDTSVGTSGANIELTTVFK